MKTSLLGMVNARTEIDLALGSALAAVSPDGDGKFSVFLPQETVALVGRNKAVEGLALSYVDAARAQLDAYERALIGPDEFQARRALQGWRV